MGTEGDRELLQPCLVTIYSLLRHRFGVCKFPARFIFRVPSTLQHQPPISTNDGHLIFVEYIFLLHHS